MSFEKPSRAPIRSHRARIGKAIVLYKKAWQRVLGPVLDSVLEFEREQLLRALSSHMDGLFQTLDRRLGAIEVDLIVLSERVRKLERDGGSAENARLTNAALLDGREKLAELRDEVEQLRAQVRAAPEAANGTRSVSRGS